MAEIALEKLGGGKRNSNLELFRIISMFVIVAHHYVVNSGLINVIDSAKEENIFASLFYLLIGWGGKTGINCFMLITGYFMCTSQITWKKFLKLVLEIEFYKIILLAIFIATGYQAFEVKSFIKMLLPITNISDNFVSCFLVFYLFIPFLNKFIRALNQRQHLILCAFLIFFFSIWGGIFYISFNYVSWFSVLFVIASYLRFYPLPIFSKTKIWGAALVASLLLSWGSVIALYFLNLYLAKYNAFFSYKLVSDSNAPLALLTAFCGFLFFKNLKLSYNKFINGIAASTFGVLLIHANSNTMRNWLWKDTLDNVHHFGFNTQAILHAVISIILVYIICTVIDQFRILLFEKPLFKYIDKKFPQ